MKAQGHYVVGYVIMPNYLHALIGFKNTHGVSINSMIGEGKRFMSYGIVRRLKSKGEEEVLKQVTKATAPPSLYELSVIDLI